MISFGRPCFALELKMVYFRRIVTMRRTFTNILNLSFHMNINYLPCIKRDNFFFDRMTGDPLIMHCWDWWEKTRRLHAELINWPPFFHLHFNFLTYHVSAMTLEYRM